VKFAFLITRSDPIGGSQIHVRDLSQALLALGNDVTVFTGVEGTLTEQLTELGVPWAVIPHLRRAIQGTHDVRAFFEIRGALKALRPDLVSTHVAKAGALGRVAAWSLGLPVIFTAHSWCFTEGVPWKSALLYRWGERISAPFGARIITVCEFDRQLAIRQRVALRRQLVTVYNGMPDISAAFRATPERSPVLLTMVARFEPQKDHDSLLHALAGLKQHAWQLDLIGEGPLLVRAHNLARDLGIADRVRFLGQRSDVAALLAQSQTFVLSSNWEGFPRSILEAMRAGLPVVASDVAGVSEAVEHGVTGFVVPRGDSGAWRLRLEQLLTDSALRASLGANGRTRYEQRFTFERTLEQTIAVYRDVLMERRGLAESRAASEHFLPRGEVGTWQR
jgi:glycosyltransferase involved in cell wall biosynthesis